MNIEPIIQFLFIVAATAIGCVLGNITYHRRRKKNNATAMGRMISDAVDLPGFEDTRIVSADITFKIMRKGDRPQGEPDGPQTPPS